jgi:hypothetical protein
MLMDVLCGPAIFHDTHLKKQIPYPSILKTFQIHFIYRRFEGVEASSTAGIAGQRAPLGIPRSWPFPQSMIHAFFMVVE